MSRLDLKPLIQSLKEYKKNGNTPSNDPTIHSNFRSKVHEGFMHLYRTIVRY